VRGVALKLCVALATCLLAVIWCSGTAEAESYHLSDQAELNPNQYYIIVDFVAQEGAQLSYEAISIGDYPVDVLVIEATYLDAYIAGPNFQYFTGSCLNDSHARMTTSYGTFETGREYVLLIDNSNDPVGGAFPTGSVEVSYSADLQNVEMPGSVDIGTLNAIIPMVMVGGMVVLFVVFAFVFRKNRNTYKTARLKQCPTCHNQVPDQNTVCPKCGGNM
jgi:hypothetical protein